MYVSKDDNEAPRGNIIEYSWTFEIHRGREKVQAPRFGNAWTVVTNWDSGRIGRAMPETVTGQVVHQATCSGAQRAVGFRVAYYISPGWKFVSRWNSGERERGRERERSLPDRINFWRVFGGHERGHRGPTSRGPTRISVGWRVQFGDKANSIDPPAPLGFSFANSLSFPGVFPSLFNSSPRSWRTRASAEFPDAIFLFFFFFFFRRISPRPRFTEPT